MTVLANARITLAHRIVKGAVRIKGTAIAAVEPERFAGDVDCGGDYLLPGFINLHTDAIKKHYQPRPGVNRNPTAAAVAHGAQIATSGITTVFDTLTFGASFQKTAPKDHLAPVLKGLDEAEAAGALRVDDFLHVPCEVTDPDTIGLP